MPFLRLTILSCFAAALLAPSTLSANEYCEDLWFTRNAIMDRAGYCFGSTLGKGVFDNRNCLGTTVKLRSSDQKTVAQIQKMEHAAQCQVDTSQRRLSLPDLAERQALWHLPIRDEAGSACVGWLGPQIGLHAGHSQDAPLIGKITPGDTIGFSHFPQQGQQHDWSYVQIFTRDWRFKSAGWTDLRINLESCADFAG